MRKHEGSLYITVLLCQHYPWHNICGIFKRSLFNILNALFAYYLSSKQGFAHLYKVVAVLVLLEKV